jgi:hypothetical protein
LSTYRLLKDHYVNNVYFSAGTTQSTADVGGLLPTGWQPTLDVDPLDTPAVNAFYAMRPGYPELIQQQFQTQSVSPPVTYWVGTPTGDVTRWSLTGLGADLSPKFQ